MKHPTIATLERYLRAPLPALSPKDERYTRPDMMAFSRGVAGVRRFDLDVAACRESHHAPTWYGLDNPRPEFRDGLAGKWFGHSFGNVPFTQWAHWVATAWLQLLGCALFRSHTMVLPNDKTDQDAWQDLVEPYRFRRELQLHFPRGRTRYSAPRLKGRAMKGSPFFGSAVLVWRRPC